MPADLDSSTSQGAVDTVSETSTATDDSVWESYPDYASSEAGNTPEIAHLNQGNPDSPNGWGDYDPADYDQYDGDDWGNDYGETAGSGDEEPDPWGDAYPDAAYPADSSNDTRRDDAHEAFQPASPAADGGTDIGQPDDAPANAADSENVLSPEQERISALETENADVKQQLADARQEVADLKANYGARLDRLERGETGKSRTEDEAHQLQAIEEQAQPEESQRKEAELSEQPRLAWSNESAGLAAAVGTAAFVVAGDFMASVPAEVAGGIGSALAIGASAVAWWRKRREVNDADRSRQ
jgi:hypothetical protein